MFGATTHSGRGSAFGLFHERRARCSRAFLRTLPRLLQINFPGAAEAFTTLSAGTFLSAWNPALCRGQWVTPNPQRQHINILNLPCDITGERAQHFRQWAVAVGMLQWLDSAESTWKTSACPAALLEGAGVARN